jgi:2-polyprenyl-3-methyl-5-hydroxy-6-metoxy-1,4-benzoquinol methylase
VSASIDDWTRPFDRLRARWVEVPLPRGRHATTEMLQLPIEEVWDLWRSTRHQASVADYAHRGWYYTLYKDAFRGKRILDVGSGFGYDGITFAMAGARVTFLDIAESNLALVRRLCEYQHVEGADFFLMRDIPSLGALRDQYDVIWCGGSLLHIPFELARQEARALRKHLNVGGRWIEWAYSKERWERDGRLSFERWGDKTDGGAPWVEWYDLEKVLARVGPEQFRVVLSFNFHDNELVWFDLERTQWLGVEKGP